jgi:hypothetical protein
MISYTNANMALETIIAAAVVYNGWRTDRATEKQTRTLLLAQESARTGKSIASLEMAQEMRDHCRVVGVPPPRRVRKPRNPDEEPSMPISVMLVILLIAILGAGAIGSFSY